MEARQPKNTYLDRHHYYHRWHFFSETYWKKAGFNGSSFQF